MCFLVEERSFGIGVSVDILLLLSPSSRSSRILKNFGMGRGMDENGVCQQPDAVLKWVTSPKTEVASLIPTMTTPTFIYDELPHLS